MFRFKIKNSVPPGGLYYYDDHDHGVTFSSPSRQGTMSQAAAYLVANNLPIPPDLGALIEDCTCRRVDPSFCDGDEPVNPRRTRITDWVIVDRTERVLRMGTFRPVNPLQIKSRWAECATCPYLWKEWCALCTGHVARILAQVRHIQFPSGIPLDSVGVCQLTGVSLVVQAALEPEELVKRVSYILDQRTTERSACGECWLKKSLG